MIAPDRLTPAARRLADALAAVFPDLGGAVTDAAEARRILAAAPGEARPPLPVGAVTDLSVPGPAGAPAVPVRVYRPGPGGPPGPRPTLLFCHGGGFVLCDLDTYDRTVRALCASTGAVVVAVEYRKAPEHPFPAAPLDVYAALCWTAAHAGELGGDPAALVVAGDSAGAALAVSALLTAARRGGPAVALQVLLCPALDAARAGESHRRNGKGYYLTAAHLRWFWERYLGPDGDPGDPLASPSAAGEAALAALPPAHLVLAGCDPLLDDGLAFAAARRSRGAAVTVDAYPGVFHGFTAFPEHLPEARTALRGLAELVAATVWHGKNFGTSGGRAG
ncbi:alpha/beta hydrolase [Streptomyces sp. NPDC097619]|uniref:alpha/beta hydrolase n=1 Tax=Streptomyces sp. NPDC097619 TaxID=3157228 RepID=UPI0033209B95